MERSCPLCCSLCYSIFNFTCKLIAQQDCSKVTLFLLCCTADVRFSFACFCISWRAETPHSSGVTQSLETSERAVWCGRGIEADTGWYWGSWIVMPHPPHVSTERLMKVCAEIFIKSLLFLFLALSLHQPAGLSVVFMGFTGFCDSEAVIEFNLF